MRTIREMLGNDENVWVYLKNEDTRKEFARMDAAEGFHFGELPFEKCAFGYVVAVHNNGDIGHLPLFIWCSSFAADADSCPRKVDFSLYSNDQDDYCCYTSHFRSLRSIGTAI